MSYRSTSFGRNRGASYDYLLIVNLRFVFKAPSFTENLSHEVGLLR